MSILVNLVFTLFILKHGKATFNTKLTKVNGFMKTVKALVLFSGGLDSQLVIKILQEQKIEIIALHFILPFGEGCCSKKSCIFNFSQVAGVNLKFIDCTQGENFREYLKIIKNPRFGRGTGLNPCIDCRIFILKKAKELLKKSSDGRVHSDVPIRQDFRMLDADFIATGEVLGERPMSQYLRALKLIEKQAGLENKILRPLSAKLLEETEVEKNEWVDRKKLYSISGRRRLPQIALAKKYGLKNYPNPAGGCLLCEKEFSKKLKTAFEIFDNLTENDLDLLKLGRHFWVKTRKLTNINTKINENSLIVVGRNQEENKKLESLAQKNDVLIEPENFSGPSALIRMGAFGLPKSANWWTEARCSDAIRGKKISEEVIEEAKKIIRKYSKKINNQNYVNFNQRKFS